jgi:hypothetical protein
MKNTLHFDLATPQSFVGNLAQTVNSLTAFNPEFWAKESIALLLPNMVVANMVHTDFAPIIAQQGDVVNTRKPASFAMGRKTDTDQVTVQAAEATNIAVPLDQHLYVSFIIKDGEESKGMQSLIDVYLKEAISTLAQGIDAILLYQLYQFLGTTSGKLGATLTQATLVDLDKKMNINKAYVAGRQLIITPQQQADLLNIDNFTTADKVGDNGTAIREASLGRRMNFNIYQCQQTPSIATGNTVVTGAVNDSTAPLAVGTTSVTVDGLSAAITPGSWCTIAGDMTPQRITASVGGSTPTSITISPGLRYAVADDAVVTIYTPGAANLTAGYSAGYAGKSGIVVDGFTVAPKTGQLLSFGAGTGNTANYGVVAAGGGTTSPSTTRVDLDRSLVNAVAEDAAVCIGPAGEYGFAFHRNALTMVSRPLAAPMPGAGAVSAVASANGVGVRVTISYSGVDQGHLVTVDLLFGVKTLDTALGAVLLSG